MVLELQRANAYWSSDGVGDGKWRSIGETESTTGAVGALPFLMGGAVKLANSKRRTLPTTLNPEGAMSPPVPGGFTEKTVKRLLLC